MKILCRMFSRRLVDLSLCIMGINLLTGCDQVKQLVSDSSGHVIASKLSSVDQVTGFKKINTKLKTLSFMASRDANNKSATIVDLVIIYDGGPLKQIETMNAQRYFASKEELLAHNASFLEVKSWELIPGQSLKELPVKYKKNPLAMYLFASYWTKGEHKLRVGVGKHYFVVLEKFKFKAGSRESDTIDQDFDLDLGSLTSRFL